MAFEADCGSSTVLEALRVASTPRFLVLGECRATLPHTRNLAVEDTSRRESSGLKIPILRGGIARECPIGCPRPCLCSGEALPREDARHAEMTLRTTSCRDARHLR